MANSLSRTYFLDTGKECSRKEFIQQELTKNKTKIVISEETGISYDIVSDVVDEIINEPDAKEEPQHVEIEEEDKEYPPKHVSIPVEEQIHAKNNENLPKKRCNMGRNCQHPEGPLLPVTLFNKRAASPDKLSYTCKECEKTRSRFNYSRRTKVPTNKLPPRVVPEHRQRILEPAPEDPGASRLDDVKMAVISKCAVDGMLTCGKCLRPISRARDMIIDHIVPLEEGGLNEVSNMHCVHKECEAHDE